MAWFTNCSSPGLLAPHFPPKMCWICICIAGPLKPFWQMKTSSKSPTDGVHIRLADRSFGRSSANGSGISAWKSDNSCLPPRCVQPNLLRLLRLRQRQPPSQRQPLSQRQPPSQRQPLSQRQPPSQRQLPRSMVLLNGHTDRLREAFQVQLLHRKRMEACSVPPIILSIPKNADRSAMVRLVCCMRPASAIAADASCVLNVKKALPPANHDGSVPFSGLFLLTSRSLHPLCSDRLRLSPSR